MTDRTADPSPAEALRSSVLGQPAQAESASPARDRIVVLMMIVVAAAVGGILHLQAGLAPPLAALGGFITFGLSMIGHALVARSAEVTRLRLEIARLELEMARLKTQGMQPPGRSAATSDPVQADPAQTETGPRGRMATSVPPEARWDAGAARKSRLTPPGQSPAQAAAPQPASEPAKQAPAREATSQPQANDRRREAAAADADIPAWAAPSQAQGEALREDWEASTREEGARPAPAARPEAPRMPHARTIEADLEMVQRKIKALADEVNATEALRASANTVVEPATPSAAIDESIAALRSTADRMKPARKGFSARPVYDNQMPAQQPAKPAAQSRAPQPQAQPAHQPATAPGQAATGPGLLPSLDALIPSTAQPIAVSNPSRDQPSQRADAEAPRAERAPPDRERPQARDPVTEPPRYQAEPSRSTAEKSRPVPEVSRSMPEPPRHVPEPPRASRTPEPARSAPQSEVSSSAAPADRRNASDRRAAERRLSEIAAAIEQRRMDVFLNPIVGLGDYAVTHFEVDVRLKAEGGSYIDDPESTLSLHANDLLALFDVERLERTAGVAEQLEARGKTGALLSPTAGHSMTDGGFLEAFARTFENRTSISGQLVLTFTQADVESFGQGTWQALSDMHSFGFRFAMEHVTHLGMDFNSLAERGFAFVKLPAEAFLDGLPAGHGMVPPADICRHLSGAGLTLVVERIDDDQLLARVFGFGALFGQGSLFGGSRQITLQALGPKRAA